MGRGVEGLRDWCELCEREREVCVCVCVCVCVKRREAVSGACPEPATRRAIDSTPQESSSPARPPYAASRRSRVSNPHPIPGEEGYGDLGAG